MLKKLLSLLLICSISLTFTFNSYANYGRHEYFELESKYNTYFFMFYGSSMDASDEDFCVSIICDQPNVTYSLRLKDNTTGQVVANKVFNTQVATWELLGIINPEHDYTLRLDPPEYLPNPITGQMFIVIQ